MKKILLLIFCLISLYWISCSSQLGRSEWEKIEDGIQLQTHDYQVRVQFYTPKIVRIVKWPLTGQADKVSLSVIMSKQPAVRIAISENDNWIFLNSDKLWLKVGREDGHIEYFGNDSLPFVKESGRPVFDPVVYDGDSGYSVQQKFELKPEEAIYGLGQHQDGYFNYRGKQVVLVQANTEAMNPFLISIRNYGILWDNYSKTVFTDSTDGAGFWSDMGDNLDYYFIAGENMDQVISGYRQLTGPAPMYGKWAYGYWQSKEHYHTQAELMGVAEKYRRLGIPIDNMIQDWDYWNGAENWSGMFFDKTLFPHPKQMCDRLHRMNYHIIISIWPALGPNTEIYADMARQGFLYKPVGWAGFKYYDAFNPQANALYLKYLKHGLYSQGLDGWWIDSTEPDVVNAMTKASSEYELKKMGSNWLGSWGRFLNAFSLVMTDALY
jgi:alpha-D-xyloside xylohydrolase